LFSHWENNREDDIFPYERHEITLAEISMRCMGGSARQRGKFLSKTEWLGRVAMLQYFL